MLTPYRGKVEVRCLSADCTFVNTRENVEKACFGCELSEAVILDLDDKPVGELKKKKKVNLKGE